MLRKNSTVYETPISWWAIRYILHELFEYTYHRESAGIEDTLPRKKLSCPDYRFAEHEEIAEGRVLRIMQIAFNAKIGEIPPGAETFFLQNILLPDKYK